MDQFLDHWKHNLMPVMKKEFPEMTPYIMKSLDEESKYAGLYLWNSIEEMGKYYMSDGSPTELGAAALEKVMPVVEGLSKFGEFTWTVANWAIVE